MSKAQTSPSAAPPDRKVLLEVSDLQTYFHTESGIAKAVDGVSFQVHEDEILGIVGESGSGKSVTSLSIMRLIPSPPGEIVGGRILFRGQNLLSLSWPEIRKVRGKDIAMIFQEPMTSLNPVFTVGMQIAEVLQQHQEMTRPQAYDRAAGLLEEVGIPDARKRLGDYPHQFSGGMRQRVMIAIALACNPALLIADEPTTALDVTIQAQILGLMMTLKARRQGSAIILITHNLAVVAETCHRVIVMYGGKIQEVAPVRELFKRPLHPYTRGLLGSIPSPHRTGSARLAAIPGSVPDIHALPPGCKFCTRCSYRVDRCDTEEPALRELEPGRWVRCHEAERIQAGGV